ncbi:uncharacterized protein AB675_3581 [Cyphellophora attinorum]|uniref:Uncharacterized protein n=1 Tax=Cyphellophora attinorum TaxID=1664694 RepID=A0A0N1H4R3_9EURO|nr:uncharacterized protein AB675_3581 [Phialophora attinorum]KPI37124.1 hypothetical protein AB675_3581 [Phialophora attinorum]
MILPVDQVTLATASSLDNRTADCVFPGTVIIESTAQNYQVATLILVILGFILISLLGAFFAFKVSRTPPRVTIPSATPSTIQSRAVTPTTTPATPPGPAPRPVPVPNVQNSPTRHPMPRPGAIRGISIHPNQDIVPPPSENPPPVPTRSSARVSPAEEAELSSSSPSVGSATTPPPRRNLAAATPTARRSPVNGRMASLPTLKPLQKVAVAHRPRLAHRSLPPRPPPPPPPDDDDDELDELESREHRDLAMAIEDSLRDQRAGRRIGGSIASNLAAARAHARQSGDPTAGHATGSPVFNLNGLPEHPQEESHRDGPDGTDGPDDESNDANDANDGSNAAHDESNDDGMPGRRNDQSNGSPGQQRFRQPFGGDGASDTPPHEADEDSAQSSAQLTGPTGEEQQTSSQQSQHATSGQNPPQPSTSEQEPADAGMLAPPFEHAGRAPRASPNNPNYSYPYPGSIVDSSDYDPERHLHGPSQIRSPNHRGCYLGEWSRPRYVGPPRSLGRDQATDSANESNVEDPPPRSFSPLFPPGLQRAVEVSETSQTDAPTVHFDHAPNVHFDRAPTVHFDRPRMLTRRPQERPHASSSRSASPERRPHPEFRSGLFNYPPEADEDPTYSVFDSSRLRDHPYAREPAGYPAGLQPDHRAANRRAQRRADNFARDRTASICSFTICSIYRTAFPSINGTAIGSVDWTAFPSVNGTAIGSVDWPSIRSTGRPALPSISRPGAAIPTVAYIAIHYASRATIPWISSTGSTHPTRFIIRIGSINTTGAIDNANPINRASCIDRIVKTTGGGMGDGRGDWACGC